MSLLGESMEEEMSTQDLLDAQTHIYNHIFSFANSMSLKCAIELGIPDAIHKHGRPMTLSELADNLPINKAKSHNLHHLMRILTHSKFFDKVQISKDEEAYRLTRASRLLVKDEPMNLAKMVLLDSDPVITGPWHHMSEWFQNDDVTSFKTKHGLTAFEHAAVDQGFRKSLTEANAVDSRFVNSVLVKECGQVFEGLESVVDVGGGTGETAKGLAAAFPGLNCVVFDLPRVVAGLEGDRNLRYVGGDMFHDPIPQGDAIFFKYVLHMFSDEDCVKVMKKCKEAISRSHGGKVIIVEMVVGDQKDDPTATETQLFFNMQMVVQLAGKERTENEWAKIFYHTGFAKYKITRALGLRSIIEVLP